MAVQALKPTTGLDQINVSKEQEAQILLYASSAANLLINQYSLRSNLEMIDRYYQRENDFSEANLRNRAASRLGDKRKMQDITVPIVMPQVRASLGYLVNVFLTGYPIFGTVADPSMEDAALQMETIIAENAVTAGWTRQLIMFFLDGLKYNLHGVECDWLQKSVAKIDNDPTQANSASVKKVLWQGNVLRRVDLYNTFFDPRVHPSEIHSEGDFAGYIEIFSRTRMKKWMNDLSGNISPIIIQRALESAPSATTAGSANSPYGYFQPQINPDALMQRNNMAAFDWDSWIMGGNGRRRIENYTGAYQVTKLYARIIPNDFNFKTPAPNTPQVWKFYIVNGSVVVKAEKMSNAHGYIPIFFGQPLEDGLDFQTKSFAGNVTDMQDIATAMWNGYIASKRRLVGDRVLYDPLRIREVDINNTNPAAKIPVRPSAYGKPVSEAVYQFPFRDEQTQTLLNGAEIVSKFADKVNGVNPAQQGQFTKGNRTKHEYDDIMGHGNVGNQTMALMTEAQVFTPMKEVIKLNVLQFQPQTVMFNRDKQQQVEVDPVDLRAQAVHFMVNDGLTPADKEINADVLQTVLQTALQAPQIAAGLDISGMFVYLMKTQGADLRPFQKSPALMQYEQELQAWQQAAQLAIQKGTPFNVPQPQPSAQLQKEQAGNNAQPPQASPTTQLPASPTAKALEATQGVR